MGVSHLQWTQLEIGQFACIVLLLISMLSGLILLILIFTKILPSTKKKNISIRIPKLMTLFLYITTWMLLIAIPTTASLFCFIDYGVSTSLTKTLSAILFTSSIIPLIITHLSRFGLLRIQHSISNATMSLNLGQITWRQYLDKFEIILQEDYNITHPEVLRKYTIYICIVLIAISVVIIIITHPFRYIWINNVALGIASIVTAIIVWIKSDTFNIKSKFDAYAILKEMHYITIILLIQFIIYLAVSATFPFYIINDMQCEGTVCTHIVLCIGITIIWIYQLKNSLRAVYLAHKPVPLTQLLSSYDGYKAFLRFLVSELSIENLEFFQLSMRWRYRIACSRYGPSNGTKQPAKNINLPFEIFSFEYLDRLLPQQDGGGLVPNNQEIKAVQAVNAYGLSLNLQPRDSGKYFSTLPMSRKASINSHFSPDASNKNSRNTTPKYDPFSGQPLASPNPNGCITAPSSFGNKMLPPTILEGNDEEEMTGTNTTTTYMLPINEYSHSSLLAKNNSNNNVIDIVTNKSQSHHQTNDTMIEHLTDNNNNIQSNNNNIQSNNNNNNKQRIMNKQQQQTLSPLSIANSDNTSGPTPYNNQEMNDESSYYRLTKIPREDEIIDGLHQNTPPTYTHTAADSKDDKDKEDSVISSLLNGDTSDDAIITNKSIEKFKPTMINTNTDSNPELTRNSTDLQQSLTPIEIKQNAVNIGLNPKSNAFDPESPTTPEPKPVINDNMIRRQTLPERSRSPQITQNVSAASAFTEKTLALSTKTSMDEDEIEIEYIDNVYNQYNGKEDINKLPTPKRHKNGFGGNTNTNSSKRIVRFAESINTNNADNTDNKDNTDSNNNNKQQELQYIDTITPQSSVPNMHDLLGGHMGVGAGAVINNNNNNNNNNNMDIQMSSSTIISINTAINKHQSSILEESVVSKAEPSWFAAWFRKGNLAFGQQERADTLLNYSDLSWRRMKKVAKEVNMSALARESIDALFKKYTRSRYLETKRITLEEYDEAMRDSWFSCWENMNDSLRRFAKSIHYETYLSSIGQLTIKRVNTNDNKEKINNKKLKFRIGSIGKKNDNDNIDDEENDDNDKNDNDLRIHPRAAPVIM